MNLFHFDFHYVLLRILCSCYPDCDASKQWLCELGHALGTDNVASKVFGIWELEPCAGQLNVLIGGPF